MTGRAIMLGAAVAFLAASLPAIAQTEMSSELLPLVNRYLRGDAGADLQKGVEAYIAAHPSDGDGFTLRCAVGAKLAAAGPAGSANLADCEKGVALSPQSMFSNYIYGDILYNAGSTAQSIAYYSKAIQLGMTFGGVFWERCDAYRLTGNLDAALADCKKQLELTPNDVMAQYAYGHLQYVRASYPDALAYLSSAIALRPKFVDALYWRASTYVALGKDALAEADLTACIELGDQSADTYFMRGQVRSNLGRALEARADLQEALTRYRAKGKTALAERAAAALASLATLPPRSPGTGLGAPNPAPSASARPVVLDGVTFDPAELAKLFAGVRAAYDPGDKTVHVTLDIRSAAKMPSYDPKWHYASGVLDPDGTPSITIWLVDGLPKDQLPPAMAAGALIGLADSGYAGTKWKELYDQFAAKDAALGSSAPDPFYNRRQLAEQLVKLFESTVTTTVNTTVVPK